ncbi:MAG: hypothetical protein ABIM89_10710 [Mycobacteriales bacterium]
MFDRWLLPLVVRLQIRKDERERGDIPGWVMITLMTVAIATAIWTLVSDELMDTLKGVLENVTGDNGNAS